MKRAVILHGTSANHSSNWFPWLKSELENLGWEVWVPDLPDADHPNVSRYNEYLLNQGWDFQDSLIIGHSSGSVEILGLLEALPNEVKIGTAILVGAFTKRLAQSPGWEMLRDLFGKPFDYENIKQKAKQFIFIHSDDDPFCPIEDARWLCKQLGGDFIEILGQKHFSLSLDPKYYKFPEIVEIIKQKISA